MTEPAWHEYVATLFYKSPSTSVQQLKELSKSNIVQSFVTPAALAEFEEVLGRIATVSSTTKRALDSKDSPYVVEVIFTTPTAVDIEHMRKNEDVKHFEYAFKIETVFQLGGAFRRHKRLAVFDMDSTLIQQEVIDEIAAKIGVQSEVAAITERAMNGELDFEGSLRQRCGLLAGVSSNVWEELKSVITLSPGAQDLVRALKRLGYKTAVLSGGFTPLATWLAGELGLDYVHANHLVVSEDGQTLTGELTGDIVHAERKRDLVREIAAKEGITLSQVLTVGDGANDLPMLGIAGLGVAFNAKPRVQELAPTRLNTSSLFDVLYLLGFSRVERQELLSS